MDQIKKESHEINETDIFRQDIMNIHNRVAEDPSSMQGEELKAYCPLKHSFGDGLYIREIFMPKGALIVSKIHKKTNPYFVLSGVCLVKTDKGTVKIEAPFHGMTMAGTKRALLIIEDTVWITVHRTDETDIKKIEEEIVAEDFEAYDRYKSEV